MILLDTNIVIGYLAGDAEIISAVDKAVLEFGSIALSTINVVELFGYQKLEEEERQQLHRFIDCAMLIHLTPELAMRAAEVRRTHRLTTTDAVIAATALTQDELLVSRDQDFKKVSGLKLLVP